MREIIVPLLVISLIVVVVLVALAANRPEQPVPPVVVPGTEWYFQDPYGGDWEYPFFTVGPGVTITIAEPFARAMRDAMEALPVPTSTCPPGLYCVPWDYFEEPLQ